VKAVAAVLGVAAVSLALVAWAVFVLGDRTVLVPPPEAVAEGFMRQLQTRRFEQARSYLARPAVRSAEDLRARLEALERAVGRIQDVRGRRGTVGSLDASAVADLTTADRARAEVAFSLRREHGEWRIADLDGLPLP
jgi:hypothetical protein